MNDLIRSAIAAEAEERVDSRTVLAELHKAKARRKPLGMIIGVAALTVAAAAATVVVQTAVHKTDASPAGAPTLPAPSAENVLLIGTDDENYTDALVLARFETDGAVSAISLPRDIYQGSSRDKINMLYLGGPRRLTDEVQHLTGTRIDHFAAIKMSEFGRIATAVGGVEVCLNTQTKDQYSGADLPAGKQTISGDHAPAFLRQRFNLPNGDLDRARRHQAFLTGLAAKITKDNAAALARAVSGTVEVDEGWDLLAFAARFQGPVKIRTATLPVGEVVQRGGTAGFAPDPAQTKEFVEKQFNGAGQSQDGCVN